MGPSGSGKTTLLNLIGGLDRPDRGEITVAGERIDNLSSGQLAKWRARNVGFIFQFYNLLPVLTAERNVEVPLLLTKLSARGAQAQRRRGARARRARGSRETQAGRALGRAAAAYRHRARARRGSDAARLRRADGRSRPRDVGVDLAAAEAVERATGQDDRHGDARSARRAVRVAAPVRRQGLADGRAARSRRMKYLPLIWAGLWRKRARTVLTLLCVVVAFALFGLLHGFTAAIDGIVEQMSDTRLTDHEPRQHHAAVAARAPRAHRDGARRRGRVVLQLLRGLLPGPPQQRPGRRHRRGDVQRHLSRHSAGTAIRRRDAADAQRRARRRGSRGGARLEDRRPAFRSARPSGRARTVRRAGTSRSSARIGRRRARCRRASSGSTTRISTRHGRLPTAR